MKKFIIVLVVLLSGCTSRYHVKTMSDTNSYKPANVSSYAIYPAVSSFRIINPGVPTSEEINGDSKKAVQKYDEQNNGYVKVNNENRRLPYENNGKMIYTNIETGQPMSTSYKLQIK